MAHGSEVQQQNSGFLYAQIQLERSPTTKGRRVPGHSPMLWLVYPRSFLMVLPYHDPAEVPPESFVKCVYPIMIQQRFR